MRLAELRSLIARHARADGSTAIDGVLVSTAAAAAPPAPSTTGTVLALITQGAKRIALGDRIYDYRAGQYLVASIDLPITGHYTEASRAEPALGFGLILRPAAIAALLLDSGGGIGAPAPGPAMASGPAMSSGPATPSGLAMPSGPATPSGLGVSDASAELVDAAVRMLQLLENPRDRPVLAPMIEREILWRLLTGEQGAAVRQIGLADSNLSRISRAVRWIRDHHAEPFRVEDLARQAGMSVSAFHRIFQAVTAMSPIQFQKRIRLLQARLLLVTRPDDVAGVGHAVGYDSPSQFSREYRRFFGTPPGRDAARLREPIPAR